MAKKPASTEPLDCPNCGEPSVVKRTRYGRRDDCERCGLHSWDGKPMVGQEVHEARKHCHEIFDRLWKSAETMYGIEERPGTKEYEIAVARIRRSARNRAYRFIALITRMPEPECHMSDQADIEKLRTIYRAAKDATPEGIRDWWKAEGEAWWQEMNPRKTKAKEADAA
ncbi:hypothetical protein [Parvibaculum sp.]|uniref:hypothetical protein n=1 Tax=Parvibaculum sp. TaxID=2024848 RepID=UPI001D67A28B|nr:hypothetical protein [Parvibaculum sp.]MBX3490849.1 hypothetical protein [Parvibaculum sp.]